MLKSFPKMLAAGALSLAVAFTGVTATTQAAHADNDNLHRFLGGAAALLIIGSIIENQRNNHRTAPVTRYVPDVPNHHRLVLPNRCFHRFQGPHSLNLRGFGANCLHNHVPYSAALPRQCLDRVFTYQGWRDVYDAQCLRRHGWHTS